MAVLGPSYFSKTIARMKITITACIAQWFKNVILGGGGPFAQSME